MIDKDHSAALLARQLGAGALLLLTNVEALFSDWGTARARAAARIIEGKAGTRIRPGEDVMLGCDGDQGRALP